MQDIFPLDKKIVFECKNIFHKGIAIFLLYNFRVFIKNEHLLK